MPTVTVTIGSPIISGGSDDCFTYMIYNSNGDLVSEETLLTNAPFDITVAAGDYKLEVVGNFNADIDGCPTDICFTVLDECDCPTLTDVAYELNENGLPYITGVINLPDGLPTCGLTFNSRNNNGSFFSQTITYNNLSQFTSLGDNNYKFTQLRDQSGDYSSITLNVSANCCNGNTIYCAQYQLSLKGGDSCYDYNLDIVQIDGLYYFRVCLIPPIYGDPPYGNLVIIYNQNNVNPNAADSGTLVIEITDDTIPFCVTSDIALNPYLGSPMGALSYNVIGQPQGCGRTVYPNVVTG